MFMEFEATVDGEGHFDIPSEVRNRHGMKLGARLRIQERGNDLVIHSAERMSPKNPVGPARAAIQKAIGFMGADGKGLDILMNERRRS